MLSFARARPLVGYRKDVADAGAANDFQADIERVNRIQAVPTILDVVCRTTGMRFAGVARVTEVHWIACSVLDEADFGLKADGELKIEPTICNEIRQSREPVVINNIAEDEVWCGHQTPALYGFQSYISMPIILADGVFGMRGGLPIAESGHRPKLEDMSDNAAVTLPAGTQAVL